ncbi:hypothetical protein EK21DRAFT_72418 [Setomelanomma holmii]|uniref:Transcription factor IIIC 90kDa subunit N-terminal domain-containing protein n=1 Tax=Setomelanomma holmii TaxID=210430 RepID=A0A9P4LJH2_9PLEO|nr:hypothetical protein EK21DRAFT_72418 [Setomelanomma holmii]
MTDVSELRCWPSCVDAIDWSQDGIIALASDERVELLFPHTVSFDRDQDSAQWQHVPLQVPWFTVEESPIKEPAPLANYSIGEEISASAPVAIAWSPIGLGKHRRSALAALTANLVLSIWAAGVKPQEASSWDRRLIINNALSEYFSSNITDDPGHDALSLGERLRLRSRVRAFSWAPALPNPLSSATMGTRLSFGRYVIATCTDDNVLALVSVDSPTTTYGAEQCWSANVLAHVVCTLDAETMCPESSFFEDMLKQQNHISHVSWSPWVIRGDSYCSLIVYATNEDVRARVVTYSHDGLKLGDEVVYPGIEMRYNGPMKWSHIVDDTTLSLALFTTTGIVHLIMSTSDASIVLRSSHGLDERWDQVSGAVWDSNQLPIPRLHVSSLLSTLQSPTAVVEVTGSHVKSLDLPSWRDQIANSAVLFSARNDLKGNTKTKVWGLATSPLGDFIATCHSVHPSDMIEYGSPNDRRGTVAVSALRQYRQIRQSFPSRDASAEGVLFTIKKLLQNTVEDSEQIPAFVAEMVEKLAQAYSPVTPLGDHETVLATVDDPIDLDMMVKRFKRIAFFNPQSLKDRYTILASQACDLKSSCDLQRTLIAYRLALASQELLLDLSQTSFSTDVRNHHHQLVSLIHTLMESEVDKSESTRVPEAMEDQDQASDMIVAVPETATTESEAVQLDIAQSTTDSCDFCAAPIPFANLFTAACTNGHQFPRCGLSFLAIKAPGITKYCGICSTPFLSEEYVLAQEMERRVAFETEQDDVSRTNGRPEDTATIQVRTDENGTDAHNNAQESLPDDRPDGAKPDQHNGTATVSTVEEGPEAVTAGKTRRTLPTTLTRVLFLACDVCIYCGGKFVG